MIKLRYSVLEQAYKPAQYNIDPLLGAALITGGLGVFNGIFGRSSADASNKQQYKYQRLLNDQTQEYNVQNMNLQHSLNKSALNYSYDLENKYNSPLAQRQRLENAGFNPFYNEDGAISAATSPNASSVGLPAAPGGTFSATPYPSQFFNLPSDFQAIASAIQSLSTAKNTDVETEKAIKSLNDYLSGVAADAKNKKQVADYQEIVTNWWKIHGNKHLDNKDMQLLQEIGNLTSQGDLNGALARLNKAKSQELENQNEIWPQIKNFLIREKKANAATAEEATKTQKATTETVKKQGDAAIIQAKAAQTSALASLRSAKVLEENGREYRLNLRSLTKKSDAERLSLIDNSIDLYEDETGVHINEAARKMVRERLISILDSNERRTYLESINPLTYIGALVGGAGSAANVATKYIK